MEALLHIYSVVMRQKVGARIHQINRTEVINSVFFLNIILNTYYFANNVANVQKKFCLQKTTEENLSKDTNI